MLDKLKELLKPGTKAVTVTHINPDGDAIGSSLGWADFLREQGLVVEVITPNSFPEFLSWMHGANDITIFDKQRDKAKQILSEAELLFCMDFNSIVRLETLGEYIKTLNLKHILIDHHLNPPLAEYFLVFSETPISSTCELVYRMIVELTGSKKIPPHRAEALYAGIMTDTGGFSHSCTAELFRLVADLIDCNIDRNKIQNDVYNNFTETRIQLIGYSLYERMKVIPEYCAAYIYLTKTELDRFNFAPGDTEGLVNMPLTIKGIRLSALFTESSMGYVRVSLRSTGEFSVNDLAQTYFNGGGHKNAAGGKSFRTMQETIEYFEKILTSGAKSQDCRSQDFGHNLMNKE
ncbi:MAG: DHH family phosphoesterase [Prevotellaceae bacterium]|jgi:phosphoesterase RecJ-like protein|nr:DHH family phosphoesterase [Prevotellaceae bacterium]